MEPKMESVLAAAAVEFRRLAAASGAGGCKGLEIGGPSWLFGNSVYGALTSVDGVDRECVIRRRAGAEGEGQFAVDIAEPWCVRTQRGRQYAGEATDLRGVVADGSYDAVLCLHLLQRIANPLKALREWARVLRPGGHALLIVPDRHHGFDHRRAVTDRAVLTDKLERDVGEGDLSSLEEILALHDLAMDPPAGTPVQFQDRGLRNEENRCLHHHVFDLPLLRWAAEAAGLEAVRQGATGINQALLCRKPAAP